MCFWGYMIFVPNDVAFQREELAFRGASPSYLSFFPKTEKCT